MSDGAVAAVAERCPVCRAPFRGIVECPRCGADLAPVMRLVAAAFRERMQARSALRSLDVPAAARHAEHALALHGTDAGRRLLRIAEWLLGTDYGATR